MKKRPEHATDCPGCKTGWVTGELLCPRCARNVQVSQPILYDAWMSARAALYGDPDKMPPSGPEGWVAIEAYRRGLIVGTALVISSAIGKQLATWRKKP